MRMKMIWKISAIVIGLHTQQKWRKIMETIFHLEGICLYVNKSMMITALHKGAWNWSWVHDWSVRIEIMSCYWVLQMLMHNVWKCILCCMFPRDVRVVLGFSGMQQREMILDSCLISYIIRVHSWALRSGLSLTISLSGSLGIALLTVYTSICKTVLCFYAGIWDQNKN